MSSSFLKSMAQAGRERVDAEYGPDAYGGSNYQFRQESENDARRNAGTAHTETLSAARERALAHPDIDLDTKIGILEREKTELVSKNEADQAEKDRYTQTRNASDYSAQASKITERMQETSRALQEVEKRIDELRSKRNRQRAAGLETGAQRGGNATVDAGMQEVSDSYQDAVQRVQRLITQLENQEKLLDSMYATYEKNPTEDLYNRYANIYDLYTRTYESYEKAMQAAEDAEKAVQRRYDSLAAYASTRTGQQTDDETAHGMSASYQAQRATQWAQKYGTMSWAGLTDAYQKLEQAGRGTRRTALEQTAIDDEKRWLKNFIDSKGMQLVGAYDAQGIWTPDAATDDVDEMIRTLEMTRAGSSGEQRADLTAQIEWLKKYKNAEQGQGGYIDMALQQLSRLDAQIQQAQARGADTTALRIQRDTLEKQLEQAWHGAYGDPNWLKYFTTSAAHGLTTVANAGYKTLAALERNIAPEGVQGPLQGLAEMSNEELQNAEEKMRRASQAMGYESGWATGSDILSSTVAAIPDALLAVLTAGSSTAATGAALTARSAGVGAQIANSVKSIAKNPQYWTSFVREFGPTYYDAIDRGESDETALATATISALSNALVEIGLSGTSGFQGLPEKLIAGNESAVLEWVKSSLEEGGEEVVQGAISRLTQKALSGDLEWEGPGGVADFEAAIQEFGLGAAVGMLIGGGQIGVNAAYNGIIQKMNDSDIGRSLRSMAENSQEKWKLNSILYDVAVNMPEGSKSRNLAMQLGEEGFAQISNAQLGAVYKEMMQQAAVQADTDGNTKTPEAASDGPAAQPGGRETAAEPEVSSPTVVQPETATQAGQEAENDGIWLPTAESGNVTLPTAEQAKQNTPVQTDESTAVDTDPAEHTAAEQQVIEAYKKSVDPGLKAFIERVRKLTNNDYRNKIRGTIETRTTNALQKAQEITGIDTTGYTHIIKGNAIQHIDNRHGTDGTADHSMANTDDFARIGFVLDNFDSARLLPLDEADPETAKLSREWMNNDNTQAPLIQYAMKVNGTYYVVEAVPSSKAKAMAVVSAYMQTDKQNGSTLNQVLNMPSGPQRTSKTPHEMLGTSSSTVSQSQPTVNANSNTGYGGILLPTAESGNVTLPTAEQGTTEQTETRAAAEPAQQEAVLEMTLPTGHETALEQTARLYGVPQATVEQVRRIADILGRKIAFYKSARQNENGYYDRTTDTLYLNARSRNPVAQIIAHELTHSLEKTDAYANFRDLILNHIQEQTGESLDNLRKQKRAEYLENGVSLKDDPAVDYELVAEYTEKNLLTSEEAIRKLVQKDRGLGQRILDWLNTLLAKLGSREAQRQVFLKNARDLYAAALQESQNTQTSARTQAEKTAQNTESAQDGGLSAGQQTDTDDVYQRTMDMMQFSFGGKNAGNADLDALNRAQEMEKQGVAADVILRETGWYIGADGKWRFEIDDSGMRYRQSGNPAEPGGVLLEDILDHEPLYQAYPQLRKARVRFTDLTGETTGIFDAQTNTITLDSSLRDAPESTIIHEVQHAIQKAEGFAGGSSTEYWSGAQAADTRAEAVERIRDEIDGLREMMRTDGENAGRIQADIDGLEKTLNNLSLYLYENTAGEIEARDASRRRNWDAQRRRETLPDIGDENTVFTENVVDSPQAIRRALGNKPFVTVDVDILNGVPEADWVDTVRKNLKTKFPNGVAVGNSNINIDYQSRKEMTFSKYMQWLYNNDPKLRADKLRATNNADEILQATTDWMNEGLNHPRKDRIVDFARGNVLLRVGTRDYIADVVVGTRKNGSMMLYDVLNLQPTTIIEKETSAAIAENPSPGTNRNTASVSGDSITEESGAVNGQEDALPEAWLPGDRQYSVSRNQDGFLDELTEGKLDGERQRRTAQADVERLRQQDLDDYFEMVRQAAEVLEPRTRPEDHVSDAVERKNLSFAEKAQDAWSYVKRKLVDSGEAVERIGKAVKDRTLYPYYNMARASSNAATSMILDRRTDVMGQDTGKGLNQLMEPIREKGADYYKKFQLYLFHLHNIDRMSRYSQGTVDAAQAALEEFRMQNPELNRYADYQLEQMARDETSALYFEAGAYIALRDAMRQAEHTKNKPVFGFDVTAADSKAIADRLLRENPEFDGLAQEVYAYIDNLLRYRVDSGLITEDDYAKLKSAYPHYVPTYRVFERTSEDTRAKNSVQIGSTIRKATGGTQRLMPLHKALAQQTMSVVREGSKNRFGQRLLHSGAQGTPGANAHVRNVTEYKSDFSENTFDQDADALLRRKNTFVVRDGGKLWEMEVSPALFEAVEALSPAAAENNVIVRLIRKGNNLFKELVTGYNPTFLVRNFMRDLQDAGLYSKDTSAFIKQYPLAVAEIAKNGKYWQQYKALGGTFSTLFDYETGETRQGRARRDADGNLLYDRRGNVRHRQNILNRIETLNMAVEQAPRLAEFMATVKKAEKKNGNVTMDDLMEAMYNAADITVNFGRSGTLGKMLNANFVPFLNPGIQGFDKMVRNVTETKGVKNWLRLVLKSAVLGIAPSVINALIYRDEPDWDDLKDRDKDINYLFKVGDTIWLKLPKGRTLSLMGMSADRIADLLRGEKVDWAAYIDTALSQSAPANPLENNILQAWFDTKLFDPENPGETWYGTDIENQRLQGYEPGQRYDTKTDAISKWLGQTFNLSPKKINYLLDQYSGVIGDVLLPLLTPSAQKDLFSAAFTIDSNTSNRFSEDFYGTLDALTYAKNAAGADGVDDIVYRYFNKQSGAISEVNAAIREIEADSQLSNAEKRELLKTQYAIRNGIMEAALNTYGDFTDAAEKYYLQSDATDESDRIEEAYRMANREILGAEYALETYSKSVYQKAQKLQSAGVDYETFYDFYFDALGMKDSEKYRLLAGKDYSDVEKQALAGDIMGTEMTTESGNPSQYAKLVQILDSGLDMDGYLSLRKMDGVDEYLDALDAGLDSDAALDMARALGDLEPEQGEDSVTVLQKQRAVIDAGLTVQEQLAALESISSESEYKKFRTAHTFGVEPDAYVCAKEILPQFDKPNANGNYGTYTQAEIEEALDALGTGTNGILLPTAGRTSVTLTNDQKAVLWQLLTGSSSAKNNPYSTSIGWDVLDAYKAS